MINPTHRPNESTKPSGPGPARQKELFLRGMLGKTSEVPVAFEDLEARARQVMRPEAFGYVKVSAGAGKTEHANRTALDHWQIVPRHLRPVEARELSVSVLGQTFPTPVLLAPVGVQGIYHPEGDLATARAARTLGIPMILSTLSSFSIEQIAGELGDTPRWFQLDRPRDSRLATSLIQRAEACGCSCLVTLDSPYLGWREIDLQNGYNPFIQGDGLANYFTDPVFRSFLKESPESNPRAAIDLWFQLATHPELVWKDLEWLRSQTKLPIALKGILHVEDARSAIEAGMDAVIVSNHGGRQVDGCVGAAEALPQIVEIAGGKIPVMFDSGIRRGADVFKALALGARCVLVGRPYAYGLGIAGEAGVTEVMRNLIAEFDLTLALSGFPSARDLNRTALAADTSGGEARVL